MIYHDVNLRFISILEQPSLRRIHNFVLPLNSWASYRRAGRVEDPASLRSTPTSPPTGAGSYRTLDLRSKVVFSSMVPLFFL